MEIDLVGILTSIDSPLHLRGAWQVCRFLVVNGSLNSAGGEDMEFANGNCG